MTDPLRNVSDAAIWWAGAWFIAGYVVGLLFAVTVWWRPISRARHEGAEVRRLRLALEDADAQLSGQFQTADRMARMLTDQAGKAKRP